LWVSGSARPALLLARADRGLMQVSGLKRSTRPAFLTSGPQAGPRGFVIPNFVDNL